MRKILLLMVSLQLITAEAGLRNHWDLFCKTHLIDDAPWWADDAYRDIVRDLRAQHPDTQELMDILISKYQMEGAKVKRLRPIFNPSGDIRRRVGAHRVYLRWLGEALRELLPQATEERKMKAYRLLYEYQRQEVDSHRVH